LKVRKAYNTFTYSAIHSYPPLIAFESRYTLNSSIDLSNFSVLPAERKYITTGKAAIEARIESKPEYMNA
jgi:hypothetical protein